MQSSQGVKYTLWIACNHYRVLNAHSEQYAAITSVKLTYKLYHSVTVPAQSF